MNLGLHTRSLLVRHAEQQLRKEQSHEASAKIIAVCLFVCLAYLVAAFIQQVTK